MCQPASLSSYQILKSTMAEAGTVPDSEAAPDVVAVSDSESESDSYTINERYGFGTDMFDHFIVVRIDFTGDHSRLLTKESPNTNHTVPLAKNYWNSKIPLKTILLPSQSCTPCPFSTRNMP